MAEGLGESGLTDRGQRFSRSFFDVNQAIMDRILGRENTSFGQVDVSQLFDPLQLPEQFFTPGASPLQQQSFDLAGRFAAGGPGAFFNRGGGGPGGLGQFLSGGKRGFSPADFSRGGELPDFTGVGSTTGGPNAGMAAFLASRGIGQGGGGLQHEGTRALGRPSFSRIGGDGRFQFGGQPGGQQFGLQPGTLGALAGQLSGAPSFGRSPEESAAAFSSQIEEPALRQFSQLTNQIASRFLPGGQTGAGAKFASGAAGDLAAQLGRQRSEFQRSDELLGAEFSERALGRQAGAIPLAFGEQAQRFGQGLQGQQFDLQSLLGRGQLAQGERGQDLDEILRRISVPSQLGGIERGIAGQQGSEAFNRFLLQQPFSAPGLAQFQGFGNPLSNFGQSLGGLGGLGQFLSGFS